MKRFLMLVTAGLLLFGFMSCDFGLQNIMGTSSSFLSTGSTSKELSVAEVYNRISEPLCDPPIQNVGIPYTFDVKQRMAELAHAFFYGNGNGGLRETKIYYECAGNPNLAVIYDAGDNAIDQWVPEQQKWVQKHYSGVVKSEGQSYGMMMCVQLGWKAEFDKLWMFAWHHMMHPTQYDKNRETEVGEELKYFFNWIVDVDNETKDYHLTFFPQDEGDPDNPASRIRHGASRQAPDEKPAPDGEEYFAMALMLAHERWGSESGDENPKNYLLYAQRISNSIIRKNAGKNMMFGLPWDVTIDPIFQETLGNNDHLICFQPNADGFKFTDPSYMLPRFYHRFAYYAVDDAARDRYTTIAQTTRDFLKNRLIKADASKPFPADFTTFDGNPWNPQYQWWQNPQGSDQLPWDWSHDQFKYDAWRVPMNIGMDAGWSGAGEATYGDSSEVDGTGNHIPWMNRYANEYVKKIWNSRDSNGIFPAFWDAYYQAPATFSNGNGGTNIYFSYATSRYEPGLVATTAVLATWVSEDSPSLKALANQLILEAWNNKNMGDNGDVGEIMPYGTYRYYKSCLTMLSMMYLCGYHHITSNVEQYQNLDADELIM